MTKHIFRTKSISEFISETKQDGGMNRVLGTFGLTMLGIGAIVGTGIFVLTGVAAANYSGPALIISFIIAALACGCAALCYAEFAAMVQLPAVPIPMGMSLSVNFGPGSSAGT